MPYEIVVAGLSGAGVDTWALWAKIMGAGATVTLSALLTLFTWALYRHRDQAASAALHFTVANLCATTYVASDIAVRLCLLTDNLGAVMVPYRLSLSAVVLALASLIALYQVLGDRPGGRRLAAIYMVGAALTGLIWLKHPWLVLASHDYRLTAVGVFADYGALAGPFYAVCLAVLAVVAAAMLRRAHQARGRVLWRMTVFGFSLFFAAGVHDAFRELGWEWLPFSTLASACVLFQFGAFAAMTMHYSRTLRERTHHNHQMRRLADKATRDPLSGLFNRAYLEQQLDQGAPWATGALLFIDLDHFKVVNDHFGHDRGDRLIQAVAEGIRATLRDHDIACRWGGDEFVVYLNDADQTAALAVAERLLRAFRHLDQGAGGPDMSASVGVAVLTDGDWRLTLQRADQALLRAKAEGRNRLAVAC